jgi:hypothetical protein
MSAGSYWYETAIARRPNYVSTLAFQTRVIKRRVLKLAPSKSMGRGSAMLTQQSPSATTTKMMCPVCGDYLRLTVIEPHYNGKRLDNHIFACSKCDEIQTYVF